MTARTASLRVAHSRSCPNVSRTSLDSTGRGSGCNCTPSYFTFYRGSDGRPIKGERFKDRRKADRELTAIQHELNEGRGRSRSVKAMTFNAWADEWLDALEVSGKAGGTLRAYRNSINHARKVFGHENLRTIGNTHLVRFQKAMLEADGRRLPEQEQKGSRARGQKPATIAKHLRHLSACFEAARDDERRLLDENPMRRFRKRYGLKAGESLPTYFTDAELRRLWTAMEGFPEVYRHLCRCAVTTGLRVGELAALRWGDVNLSEAELHVRRTYNPEDGFTLPKSKRTRVVHLTPSAVKVLGSWLEHTGVQPDEDLVFPNRDGNPMSTSNISNRILNPAMKAAGIAKEGEEGRDRSFHSFRHTFARILLEQATPIDWVSRELGHATVTLTTEVYGHWSKDATKATAAAVPEGAFAL